MAAGGSFNHNRAAAALAALLVFLAATSPWVWLLAGVWGLAAFCHVVARRARGRAATGQGRAGAGLGLGHHLCAVGVLYLIPIGVATTFYVLLSLYISWFGDSLSVGSLIALQRGFEDTSRFFADTVKLSEVEMFAVLLGLYLVSCGLLTTRGRPAGRAGPGAAGPGSRSRERLVASLHRAVGVYGRYSGPVAAGLATLAAFTFFGMQLGEPARDLRLRVKIAQEGYAELLERTEAELTERVSTGLYDKVRSSFPPAYREAFRLPEQIGSLADSVRADAERARVRHGVVVPAVQQTLAEEASRRERVRRLLPEVRVDGVSRSSVPAGLTVEQVEAARSSLGPRHASERVQLLAEGEKAVTLHVEKLVSERILLLTKPVTDAVPILEPLVQAFAEVADTTLQQRMSLALDRAMEATMRGPEERTAAIRREAWTIVTQTDVQPAVDRATPRALEEAERLRRRLAALEAGRPLIDRRVSAVVAARRAAAAARPRGPQLLDRELLASIERLRAQLRTIETYRRRIELYRQQTWSHPWSRSPSYSPRPPPYELDTPRVTRPRPPVRVRVTPRIFFIW